MRNNVTLQAERGSMILLKSQNTTFFLVRCHREFIVFLFGSRLYFYFNLFFRCRPETVSLQPQTVNFFRITSLFFVGQLHRYRQTQTIGIKDVNIRSVCCIVPFVVQLVNNVASIVTVMNGRSQLTEVMSVQSK